MIHFREGFDLLRKRERDMHGSKEEKVPTEESSTYKKNLQQEKPLYPMTRRKIIDPGRKGC